MRTMIDPDTALALVLEHAHPLAQIEVPLHESAGLILAASIHADNDYPPFDRTMMDGYAVRVADAGHTIPIRGEAAAGSSITVSLEPGTAIEIMTGAPCPAGTELVVAKEDVSVSGDAVSLPESIVYGQNITRRGTECAEGREVLRRGDVVTPIALASIATFGVHRVSVYPRPKVAIITTGDELVSSGEIPGPSQIRNSNGPMLAAMTAALGISPTLVAHAKDRPDELRAALQTADHADVVILTGAVSAGKYDGVPDALAIFGATPVFHKVMQRPGKPIYFATRGDQLIFGLPGNPLSCHLGYHRYVAPAIRARMHGVPVPPRAHGVLEDAYVMKGPRTVFQLGRAEDVDGTWRVRYFAGKGSADIYTGATANALLRFDPGQGMVQAGEAVDFEWLLLGR
ncbi:MAG: molybdopterin molybdotransferase MoeA [Candidatus Hydrogenedentes bacterium]|nr:molybdopterin molybdotransferase MoeA [Candidatus Hydrogenedentota bacterium]